jgi:hypothetical protein
MDPLQAQAWSQAASPIRERKAASLAAIGDPFGVVVSKPDDIPD